MPCTAVAFDPSTRCYYTGNEDGSIVKYDSNFVEKERGLEHTQSITEMAIHGDSVFTCSLDFMVMKISKEHPSDQAIFQRVASPLRTVHVSPSGEFFVIAGDQMDLCVGPLADSFEMQQFEKHKHRIVSARFDFTNQFIASLGYDGFLIIWERVEKNQWQPIAQAVAKIGALKGRDSSMQISWNPNSVVAVPNQDSILLYDAINKASRIQSVKLANPSSLITRSIFNADGSLLLVASESEAQILAVKSGKTVAALTMNQIVAALWIDTQNAVIFSSDGVSSRKMLVAPENSQQPSVEETSNEFQEETLDSLIEQLAEPTVNEEKGEAAQPLVHRSHVAQYSFMPGSTPFAHNQRYLAYTPTARVVCRQDEEVARIDVEFSDKERYRPIRFVDNDGYSMASIGSRGVLFASEYLDSANVSRLRYFPFEGSRGNIEWSVTFSEDHSVSLIAMSRRNAVVFTESKRLILYSATGVLRSEIHFSCRSAICMTANDSQLLILWADDAGCSQYSILDLEQFEVVASGIVAIAGDPQFIWCGFSEIGMPLLYREDGSLFGWAINCFKSWVPLWSSEDLLSNRVGSFWPIGLTFDGALLSLTCAPGVLHPDASTSKVTIPTEIPIKTPPVSAASVSESERRLLGMQFLYRYHRPTESQMNFLLAEDAAFGNNVRSDHLDSVDLDMDKVILELMLGALTSDREARAIELLGTLSLESSYDKAIKLAQHLRLYEFADSVDLLREKRFSAPVAAKPTQLEPAEQFSQPIIDSQPPPLQRSNHSSIQLPAKRKVPTDQVSDGIVPASRNPFLKK